MTLAVTLAWASLAHAATIFQISGGGYGHGIGMSQYGAYGYALHGESYQFILAHYFQGTQLGAVNPSQTVRVLIATGAASFSGASSASAPGTSPRKLNPSRTYSVRVLPTGQLALYSHSGKRIARYAGVPLTVTGPAPLSLAGHGTYRGWFEFRPVGSAVQTVNAVGLDDYVQGVVAAEMPSTWAAAALEAQAVAARTYAITSDVNGDGYQLYPDTRSQMYGGVSAETPASNAAVAATRGQVVTYDGAPVTTYFFSSSGGYTENIENVWLGASPEPWLHGVPDPYDNVAGNPYYRWTDRMTLAAAKRRLGSLVKGRLRGIRVTQRGVSPRIVYAEVVGSRGTASVTGSQLEQLFGLPSTYMHFTTISSVKVRRPALPQAELQRFYPAALHAAVDLVATSLSGDVFPASRGSIVTIQRQVREGWRTAGKVRTSRTGSYAITVANSGSYRILFDGVAGPTVTIS